jgi:hypothetical protein
MTNNNNSGETKVISGGGISLSTILGVVFIILKLTGVISWSWVWVLAPFWIPLALVALIVAIIIIITIIRFIFNR